MSEPRHSIDYRSARVRGVLYEFTPMQADVIRILWAAWERGLPSLHQRQILQLVESECPRLINLFEQGRHPAWRTLVVSGESKGTFRLALDAPAG